MAILTTMPNAGLKPTASANDLSPAIAQAIETTVNAVLDAAWKSAAVDSGAPDDSLVVIAVWIVDMANAVALDALSLSRSAPLTDAKAQQVADCARRWALVGAIVAVIVMIVVAVIASIGTFGASAPMVASGVVAAAAIISAVCAVVQGLPAVAATLQTIVCGTLQALPSFGTPSTAAIPAALAPATAVQDLRSAMTIVQSTAAQHAPSISVDLNQSLVAADQASRAMQKLLAYLTQQRYSGRAAVLVTEFGRLTATHGAVVAQLRSAQPTR